MKKIIKFSLPIFIYFGILAFNHPSFQNIEPVAINTNYLLANR